MTLGASLDYVYESGTLLKFYGLEKSPHALSLSLSLSRSLSADVGIIAPSLHSRERARA